MLLILLGVKKINKLNFLFFNFFPYFRNFCFDHIDKWYKIVQYFSWNLSKRLQKKKIFNSKFSDKRLEYMAIVY